MLRIASLALVAFAAAPLAVEAIAQDRGSGSSWTNISRDGGWISVQRNRETQIEGSGRIVRRARASERFDSVHVMGPARLELVVGPRHSIEVETDDNLTDLIGSRVAGGELIIEPRGSFRTRTAPFVRITTPTLERLRLQGSGDGRVQGLAGGNVEVVSQGSGDLIMSGRAARVTAKLYGSGNAFLADVRAPHIDVAVFGSGLARVHATGTLSAAVYGSGAIAYSGNPSEVRRSIHGSGSINPAR